MPKTKKDILENKKVALKYARRFLKEGRKLIDTVGWVKGRSRKYSRGGKITGFCSTGAINEVRMTTTGDWWARYAGEKIAIRALSKAANREVINFNDDKKTRKVHILNAFDEASKLLRKRDAIKLTEHIV